MPIKRVLVLGGSGFVGSHLVARLVSDGCHVVVPTRRYSRARHLILLPTVNVVEADIHDPAVLARLALRAEAVINLVGVLNETGRDMFARNHVELPREVTIACKAAAVRRLLQMSALNADPRGPSRYLRSKGEGEAIVAGSGLDWTVFRPSVIFGRGDSFLTLFARLARALPVIALASPNARFQPVFVGDVVRCFAQALRDDRTVRQRYDLCGPKAYTLRELIEYVGEVTGARRPVIPLGPSLSRLQAAVLERLPGTLLSRDNLDSMTVDNVCAGRFPDVFGLEPQPLEAVAPSYLSPASLRSPYDEFRAERR